MGCAVFKPCQKIRFKIPSNKFRIGHCEIIKKSEDILAVKANWEIINYIKALRAPILALQKNSLYIKRKLILVNH